MNEPMTVRESRDKHNEAIAAGFANCKMSYCVQLVKQHIHLPITDIKFRKAGVIQHSEVNQVILEIT